MLPDLLRARLPLRMVGALCPALVALSIFAGCGEQEGQYAIWPKSARTGETIAVLISTEIASGDFPESVLLDAGVESIMIELRDESDWRETVTPRAVLEAPAAAGSVLVGESRKSWTGVVAIFDVPDPWPNPAAVFPSDFAVSTFYDGTGTGSLPASLHIVGQGGAPILFAPSATPGYDDQLGEMQLRPMLRLRPRWDSVVGEGFDPSWSVGGLEFVVRYTKPPSGDVAALDAIANGDAVAALTMVSGLAPEGEDKLWKISLIDPAGFTIPAPDCGPSHSCPSGRWSLLDLPLEKIREDLPEGEEVFVVDDFSLEDLRIVDPDGVLLADAQAGEPYFERYVVNNRAVPEPAIVLQLVVGSIALAAADRARNRRLRA